MEGREFNFDAILAEHLTLKDVVRFKGTPNPSDFTHGFDGPEADFPGFAALESYSIFENVANHPKLGPRLAECRRRMRPQVGPTSKKGNKKQKNPFKSNSIPIYRRDKFAKDRFEKMSQKYAAALAENFPPSLQRNGFDVKELMGQTEEYEYLEVADSRILNFATKTGISPVTAPKLIRKSKAQNAYTVLCPFCKHRPEWVPYTAGKENRVYAQHLLLSHCIGAKGQVGSPRKPPVVIKDNRQHQIIEAWLRCPYDGCSTYCASARVHYRSDSPSMIEQCSPETLLMSYYKHYMLNHFAGPGQPSNSAFQPSSNGPSTAGSQHAQR